MEEKKRKIKLNYIEKQILQYIASGFSDQEIAQKTHRTYYSIRSYVYSMEKKTGTVNRPHLVSWAYRSGILKYLEGQNVEHR